MYVRDTHRRTPRCHCAAVTLAHCGHGRDGRAICEHVASTASLACTRRAASAAHGRTRVPSPLAFSSQAPRPDSVSPKVPPWSNQTTRPPPSVPLTRRVRRAHRRRARGKPPSAGARAWHDGRGRRTRRRRPWREAVTRGGAPGPVPPHPCGATTRPRHAHASPQCGAVDEKSARPTKVHRSALTPPPPPSSPTGPDGVERAGRAAVARVHRGAARALRAANQGGAGG